MKPLLPDFAMLFPAYVGQSGQFLGHVNILHSCVNHYTAGVDCKRLMRVPGF